MQEVLKHGPNNHYTLVDGHPELRESIAENFKKHVFKGRDIDPNREILITGGAIGSLYNTINNLINFGDEVLMFEPFFSQYLNHIEIAGGIPRMVPVDIDENNDWSFDFDKFEKAINPNTKLVILTNPHNPTGKLMTRNDVARLTEILDKYP